MELMSFNIFLFMSFNMMLQLSVEECPIIPLFMLFYFIIVWTQT